MLGNRDTFPIKITYFNHGFRTKFLVYNINVLKSFLKFPIVSPKFLLKKKPKNRHVFKKKKLILKKMWS